MTKKKKKKNNNNNNNKSDGMVNKNTSLLSTLPHPYDKKG